MRNSRRYRVQTLKFCEVRRAFRGQGRTGKRTRAAALWVPQPKGGPYGHRCAVQPSGLADPRVTP